MTFTDEEMKKCFQILDELLEEYNIPNKLSPDGISRIDGKLETISFGWRTFSVIIWILILYNGGFWN